MRTRLLPDSPEAKWVIAEIQDFIDAGDAPYGVTTVDEVVLCTTNQRVKEFNDLLVSRMNPDDATTRKYSSVSSTGGGYKSNCATTERSTPQKHNTSANYITACCMYNRHGNLPLCLALGPGTVAAFLPRHRQPAFCQG